MAKQLVKIAQMTRNLKGSGLEEGASTRLLVHAAKLMKTGVEPVSACRCAIAHVLTDDPDMLSAINELSSSLTLGDFFRLNFNCMNDIHGIYIFKFVHYKNNFVLLLN
jgi:CbbQ/NirQ/NorQ C-terminal